MLCTMGPQQPLAQGGEAGPTERILKVLNRPPPPRGQEQPVLPCPALPLGSLLLASAKLSFWALLLGGAYTWDKGTTVKPQT